MSIVIYFILPAFLAALTWFLPFGARIALLLLNILIPDPWPGLEEFIQAIGLFKFTFKTGRLIWIVVRFTLILLYFCISLIPFAAAYILTNQEDYLMAGISILAGTLMSIVIPIYFKKLKSNN